MLYSIIIVVFAFVLLSTIRNNIKLKNSEQYKVMPHEWVIYLEEKIKFYKNLSKPDQEEFKSRVLHFINTTSIVGFSNMSISGIDKLLVGISAIIPIFRFKNWEYHFLNEVIIYPKAIPGQAQFKGSYVNGLVGKGPMEGRMILAKDALYHAFSNNTDRKNVGIHEFAHIIDKQDGKIDGIPNVLLDETQIGPWLELIRSKSKEIREKKAKINNYALTNDAEFFAVVTEYFFEHPEMMVKKHPELYKQLEVIFNKDLV